MRPVFKKYFSLFTFWVLVLLTGVAHGESWQKHPGHTPKIYTAGVHQQEIPALGWSRPDRPHNPNHIHHSHLYAVEESQEDTDERDEDAEEIIFAGYPHYLSGNHAIYTLDNRKKLASGGPSIFQAGSWYLHICVFLI